MLVLDGKISVIMPGYNEGKKIYNNIIEVDNTLHNMVSEYEIIFVDDGSVDDTLKYAKRAEYTCETVTVVGTQTNNGKGNALKLGTELANGKYIVFLDSDLDLPPYQIDGFLKIMMEKNCDVVIGSKLHKNSVVNYPFQRRIISMGYYIFLVLLFRLKVKDTQTGIKLFKANIIKPVMETILVKRFAFDIEVLSVINRHKYKICEAPIILDYKRETKWGRIKLKDIWNVFVDTLAIFYRLYIVKYYDKININDDKTKFNVSNERMHQVIK